MTHMETGCWFTEKSFKKRKLSEYKLTMAPRKSNLPGEFLSAPDHHRLAVLPHTANIQIVLENNF